MTGWRTLGCFLLVQGACLWLWTSRCSVPQRAVPVESSNGLHSLPKEPSESTAAATESEESEESTESEAAESEGSEESTESETSEERSEDLAPEAPAPSPVSIQLPAERCEKQPLMGLDRCGSTSGHWIGKYDAPEREGRAAVVVDIGCNKGYYSARAHKRFAPTEAISAKTVGQAHKELKTHKYCGNCMDCKEGDVHPPNGYRAGPFRLPEVHCVEGSPRTAERTKTALLKAGRGRAGGMRFYNLAFTNFSGSLQFGDCDAVETCGIGGRLGRTKPVRTVTVKAMTLDGFVQERGMRYIDLVKIDVEGAEPLVLQGAAATFAAHKVGFSHFEVNNKPMGAWKHFGVHWMVSMLDSHGYDCYAEAPMKKKKYLVRITGCLHASRLMARSSVPFQYNMVCAARGSHAQEVLQVAAFL